MRSSLRDRYGTVQNDHCFSLKPVRGERPTPAPGLFVILWGLDHLDYSQEDEHGEFCFRHHRSWCSKTDINQDLPTGGFGTPESALRGYFISIYRHLLKGPGTDASESWLRHRSHADNRSEWRCRRCRPGAGAQRVQGPTWDSSRSLFEV